MESRHEPSLDLETGIEHALADLRNAEAGGDGKARWQQYMLLAQLERLGRDRASGHQVG